MIPILPGTQVNHIVNSDDTRITTLINNEVFVGTGKLILKDDIAPTGFKSKINLLENNREVTKDTFKEYSNVEIYSSNRIKIEVENNSMVVIVTSYDGFSVNLNYRVYSYLKKLGLELRFIKSNAPIGLFKDGEFVGLTIPMRFKK